MSVANRMRSQPKSDDNLIFSQLRFVLSTLVLPLLFFFLTRYVAVSFLGFTQTNGDVLAVIVVVVTIHVILISYAVRAFREETQKRD